MSDVGAKGGAGCVTNSSFDNDQCGKSRENLGKSRKISRAFMGVERMTTYPVEQSLELLVLPTPHAWEFLWPIQNLF